MRATQSNDSYMTSNGTVVTQVSVAEAVQLVGSIYALSTPFASSLPI